MRTGGTIAVSAGGDERAAGDAVGSGPLTVGEMHVRAGASTVIPGGDDESVAAADMTSKKGANMTERVPVPSSEHVAEIVGRQGCKIKALRNKTNTYIKTPVRGEEPVFVVTGRRQDVDAARREIMSAAEHFTQIRASRRHHHAGRAPAATSARRRTPSPGGRPNANHRQARSTTTGTAPSATTTLWVRVPVSMVGLVVGPKGTTIKRIQADTGTYIVTPGRDRDPVFEVIGSLDAVEKARQHIDAYIESRLAATSTADREQQLSVLRPLAAAAAGEMWSSGELDGVSSRLDAVNNRDAVSRLLAFTAEYGRPSPPTSTWPLSEPSTASWSNWAPTGVEEDAQLASKYGGVQSTALARGGSDADDVISALYARMLLAETGCRVATQLATPPRDEYWSSVEVGHSPPGCGSLSGVVGRMSASGSAETSGSFVSGDAGGMLADLYVDGDGAVSCWESMFSGLSDANYLSTPHRRAAFSSAAAVDEPALTAGPWQPRPDIDISAALGGGGSCGSDVATSPSYSPAESSTGSAA